MKPFGAGSFRVFRLLGIDVYIHWAWVIVVGLLIYWQSENSPFSSIWWTVAVVLSLFGIVLVHEFGHALACRSVGGVANTIILWPLGGVAFVQPPRRPGPVLWSIAAGPLVNVLLIPPTVALWLFAEWTVPATDLAKFSLHLMAMNVLLLVFNMLPIYPLDGGQILQSLLWFVLGQATALRIVAVVGLIAGVLGAIAAVAAREWLLLAMAYFIGMRAWAGFREARRLAYVEEQERLRYEAYAQQWGQPGQQGWQGY